MKFNFFIYVFLSVPHFLLVQNGMKLQYVIYPTLTIISCSSYIFTQIFENHFFDFKEGCFRKFCCYEYSRAVSDHERVNKYFPNGNPNGENCFFYLSWNIKKKCFWKCCQGQQTTDWFTSNQLTVPINKLSCSTVNWRQFRPIWKSQEMKRLILNLWCRDMSKGFLI